MRERRVWSRWRSRGKETKPHGLLLEFGAGSLSSSQTSKGSSIPQPPPAGAEAAQKPHSKVLERRISCRGEKQQSYSPATYHDAVVDEATTVASGFQVGVLLRARHFDRPDLLPGFVQLHVHGVDTRVVGGHRVPHVGGDAVLLQGKDRGLGEQGDPKNAASRLKPASPQELPSSKHLDSKQGRLYPCTLSKPGQFPEKGGPGAGTLGGHLLLLDFPHLCHLIKAPPVETEQPKPHRAAVLVCSRRYKATWKF